MRPPEEDTPLCSKEWKIKSIKYQKNCQPPKNTGLLTHTPENIHSPILQPSILDHLPHPRLQLEKLNKRTPSADSSPEKQSPSLIEQTSWNQENLLSED